MGAQHLNKFFMERPKQGSRWNRGVPPLRKKYLVNFKTLHVGFKTFSHTTSKVVLLCVALAAKQCALTFVTMSPPPISYLLPPCKHHTVSGRPPIIIPHCCCSREDFQLSLEPRNQLFVIFATLSKQVSGIVE